MVWRRARRRSTCSRTRSRTGHESASAELLITVTGVNDAPVLAGAGGTVIFSLDDIPNVEGGTSSTGTSSTGTSSYTAVIDSSLAVSDVDDVVIEGATISISSGFVHGEDDTGLYQYV